MVGTMVALPETPVSEDAVRQAISQRLRPEFIELNYEALRVGIQSLK
jgi:Pyruvate/2-oxoacid:ferredoxin oxidoreductase gamma subunit